MTPKYWAGIVAAMLAIFAVGMLVAKGVQRGRDFVTASFPMALGMLKDGFRLDGNSIADVQQMQFMRSSPGNVDSAVLTIKLHGDVSADKFDHCALRAINAQPISSRTRFECTSSADSAELNLKPFGHVVVLPAGRDVTLFIPEDDLDDVAQHAYRGTGSGDSGDISISATEGHFSMTVNGKELVRAGGDSNGGSFVIRGANGRPIVEIHGDSAGGSVKVTDGDGKTRVNIHGTSSSKHGDND